MKSCHWYKPLEKASRSWYHTWFSTESWHLTRTGMVNEMVYQGLCIHPPMVSESAALLGHESTCKTVSLVQGGMQSQALLIKLSES